MRSSKKIVLGGILSALSLIFLFAANVSPLFDLCLTVIASFAMFIGIIELGRKWAFIMYVVVSVLGFLIVPKQAPLLIFVFFLGYYPLIKSIAEQRRKRSVEYIIKFCVLNAASIICLILFKGILFPDTEVTPVMGVLYIIASNVIFIIYDKAITRLITVYTYKFRQKLNLGK